MNRVLVTVVAGLLFAGCVYPNQQVFTADDRPSVFVVGAPSGAILYIDGLEMGPSDEFNGQPNVLVVEPGPHRIEVRLGSRVLHSADVYLGEGTRREIRVSQ